MESKIERKDKLRSIKEEMHIDSEHKTAKI